MRDMKKSGMVPALGAAAALCACYWWWHVRRKKRVVIVCAVWEEARHIEQCLNRSRVVDINLPKRRRVRGFVGDVVVDVVTCGVGEVDAAMVVTAIFRENLPDLVLSVGCSGAHSKHLHEGDVVVGTAVVPTAYKMLRRSGESHHVGVRLNTTDPPLREILCDAEAVEVSVAAATHLALPAWPSTPALRPTVYRGKVGSSDTWSQCLKEIARQHGELGTLCEEMEAFGCARVCLEFGVPCLCIKDIVNSELKSESEDANRKETGLAESLLLAELGRRAALVALAMIPNLFSSSSSSP